MHSLLIANIGRWAVDGKAVSAALQDVAATRRLRFPSGLMCVFVYVGPRGSGRTRRPGTVCGALRRVASSCETEVSTMATGSFRETGCARTGFATGSPANDRHLVGDGASDVQQQIVREQESPRPDHDEAKEELHKHQRSEPKYIYMDIYRRYIRRFSSAMSPPTRTRLGARRGGPWQMRRNHAPAKGSV